MFMTKFIDVVLLNIEELGLKIHKLEEPLPVYKISRNVDIEDNFYIKYEKI